MPSHLTTPSTLHPCPANKTYQWGINPLNLDAMLENTNRYVLNSLNLRQSHNKLLDMGCGLGATARFAANNNKVAKVTGVSIAENQIAEAASISDKHPNKDKLTFIKADYHHTPFEDRSFDGIYAIESACHSPEANKASLLKEAYRLLKPGASFSLCDGFMKAPLKNKGYTTLCYKKTCQHWALGSFPSLAEVVGSMNALGFKDIVIKDLSWRILPSALYIPWVSAKYFLKLLRRRDSNPQHWHHLLAPLWGLGLACNRKRFGYYVITATKPDTP